MRLRANVTTLEACASRRGRRRSLGARLAALAQLFERAGGSSADATRRAYGAVHGEVVRQAQTLAYLDALLLLGCLCAVMVPLVFLARRARPGAAAPAH